MPEPAALVAGDHRPHPPARHERASFPDAEGLPLDGRRRPYRLTESGRGMLQRRLATLDRAVSTGIERVAS